MGMFPAIAAKDGDEGASQILHCHVANWQRSPFSNSFGAGGSVGHRPQQAPEIEWPDGTLGAGIDSTSFGVIIVCNLGMGAADQAAKNQRGMRHGQ
jgi:hypothetical protein